VSRLKTCPGCGKGGFLNLKHHRCKSLVTAKSATVADFKLLKPADRRALGDYAKEIRRAYGSIDIRTRRFHDEVVYDLVEVGLYLLKAKEAVGHGNFIDFLESETVADLNISDRSANRYMNAARNVGLTEDSAASDIDRLRKAKALHGRKPTDLYQLQDRQPTTDNDEPDRQSRWSLVRDSAIAMRDACDTALQMREQMSKKAFETLAARLHATLEAFTGSDWDMVAKRKRNHFKEHGDIYELGS
jgi:hypothetical protein